MNKLLETAVLYTYICVVEIQKMKPHKFDKDQEGNFHIDFINAAAVCLCSPCLISCMNIVNYWFDCL